MQKMTRIIWYNVTKLSWFCLCLYVTHVYKELFVLGLCGIWLKYNLLCLFQIPKSVAIIFMNFKNYY